MYRRWSSRLTRERVIDCRERRIAWTILSTNLTRGLVTGFEPILRLPQVRFRRTRQNCATVVELFDVGSGDYSISREWYHSGIRASSPFPPVPLTYWLEWYAR